jgi:DNA helicase II / ATP-dependent DNA helicase PcrA
MNFLDNLNEVQRQAAIHKDGPSMIIAGAGSGKTRVLTYKITNLIKENVDPFNILALTFTNKAAKEMTARISELISYNEARNIWMGTFHSVFAKILRTEAEKIGYPSNFTIYDTDDAKNLIKSILKEMELDDKIYKPNLVYGRISNAKNNLVSARAYMNNTTIQSDDRQAAKPKLGEIYLNYEKRCFQASAMDFDDLLFKTNVLLRDFPDVLHKYQQKFKYILVDEFQDTNYSQYLILKQLAAKHENISVVGDDAQSIYAFRGANIQNILNFKRDYPDTKIFKLEQNYRSTSNIVKAANSVIKNNKDQIKKEVWTSNDSGDKISILRSLTDNEEGRSIANEIYQEKSFHQLNYDNFAVLYRTNAQSRALEEALRKRDIPYKIYGGMSFYQRKEIKDLLAYIRLSINHNDEEALKRIINYPTRGIGKTTIDKIIVTAAENNTSIWNIITNQANYNLGFNLGTAQKLRQFSESIAGYSVLIDKKDAYETAKHIAGSSGILSDLYNDKSPEGVSRYENIQELLNGIKEFSEKKISIGENALLSEYMQDIALLTDTEEDNKEDVKRVALMTIHAAKGLEFKYVFIAGLEENLFPSQLSINSRTELEEERRLFYVAITRAEKKLYLSYAASRYKWGTLSYCEPSRFIKEIDSIFIDDKLSTENIQKTNTKTIQSKLFTPTSSPKPYTSKRNLVKISNNATTTSSTQDVASNSQLKVGNTVEHERFGIGKIELIEGEQNNQKATVNFEKVGPKQLLLKFAKLKVLS